MVRRKLEERRTAEMEIQAIDHQIELSMDEGAPKGYPSGRTLEKIPDELIPRRMRMRDEEGNILSQYALPGGRTNNPQGARLQHEEGYRETLVRLVQEKQGLFTDVERLIESMPPSEGRARTILRYYYCQGWTDARIAKKLKSDNKSIGKARKDAIRRLEEINGEITDFQADMER